MSLFNPATINVPSVNAATATATSVSVATTASNALTANVNRKAYTAFNAGSTPVFLSNGTTATTSLYTARLDPGGFYEKENYTGLVSVIGAAAGTLLVTEFV